jgi:hypothetical protein
MKPFTSNILPIIPYDNFQINIWKCLVAIMEKDCYNLQIHYHKKGNLFEIVQEETK